MRLLLQKMKKAKTLMPITEKKVNVKFLLLFLNKISLLKSSLLQILMPDVEKKVKTLTIMDEKVETLMPIMEKKAKNFTPIMKKKKKITLLFLSKYLLKSKFIADNTRDILNDHRGRNHPNKPPSEQRLLKATRHQL